MVCQCKSFDDQGRWPILPTRTAVVARLEKRQTRSLVLRQEHYSRLATLKRQKKHFLGLVFSQAAGPSCFRISANSSLVCNMQDNIDKFRSSRNVRGAPTHHPVSCRSRLRYCGCKVIVRETSRTLRGLGIGPAIQIPMSVQCQLSESRLDGPRLQVQGLAIG